MVAKINYLLPTYCIITIKVLPIFFILGAILSSTGLYAEVYKWTDSKGKVHFSDKPPANQKAEDITEEAKVRNVDTSQAEQTKLNKIFAKETEGEKQLRRREIQQKQLAAQEAKKRCEKARKDLKFISEKQFYTVDKNGNDTTMSERERNQLAKDYAEIIKKHCN